MAAGPVDASALVLIEPSPPGEVQGFDLSATAGFGTFDPEEVYGSFPSGMRALPKSIFARSERKQGVSAAAVDCPCSTFSGDEFPEERGSHVADFYNAEHRNFPGLNHWDLVSEPKVRQEIGSFLGSRTGTWAKANFLSGWDEPAES